MGKLFQFKCRNTCLGHHAVLLRACTADANSANELLVNENRHTTFDHDRGGRNSDNGRSVFNDLFKHFGGPLKCRSGFGLANGNLDTAGLGAIDAVEVDQAQDKLDLEREEGRRAVRARRSENFFMFL